MSAGNSSPFSPSTSRKEAATPPKPNPKIKQRRTNFASEIGTTICNSPSFTSKGRGKTLVTSPNPNRNPFFFVDGRLLHCRTNCNSDTATKTQFPLDLIEEILLRLGVKSLLRFKCVSKQWFSILSNQQFITRHLKIQTSIRTCQEFIVQNFEETKFAIGTLDDNADGIRFRLLETNYLQVQPSNQIWDFLGHCIGLVSARLYSEETDRSSIVVWNPSTRERRRFPIPQCCLMDFQEFRFGYDSVSNDYKLVGAKIGISKLDKIQSLSLKRGLWKTVQCDVDYSFDFSEGVHFNGCIYCLINRQGRFFCGIAIFDLSTDRLREEESLSWMLSNKSNTYAGLELSGESLCLVESPDGFNYDMWMMEENVVTHTKSWIKLFRVSITDGNFNTPIGPWAPVCFTGNGKVLIFWYSRGEYALYHPHDQSVNKVEELGNPIMESWPVSPYVESLVSLG